MYRTTRHRALPGRRGRTPVDLGSGASEAPGFFLAYWRRTESGTWRIAAFVLNQGGPQALPLPEGFGTPAKKLRRNFPHVDLSDLRRELRTEDAAFSALSVAEGTGPANAIAVSGGFVFGPDVTLDRVRVYTAAVRSRRSHEHLVAILRERSDTPVEELERLRAPAMPRRFADLELDPATRDVRRAGLPVTLRPKEYDLLRALVARAGAVASRRELLAEVWDIRRT